jgi:hypothetical protein
VRIDDDVMQRRGHSVSVPGTTLPGAAMRPPDRFMNVCYCRGFDRGCGLQGGRCLPWPR